MTERLIEKIDRLANEAGIKEVTPEIRRFAMLVREDLTAQWDFKCQRCEQTIAALIKQEKANGR